MKGPVLRFLLNPGNFFYLLALCAFSCQTTNRQYTSKPTKSLSNPDSDLLEVNAVAYHVDDSTTKVYLEVKNENLLYKRPDSTMAFYAELKITYKLLDEQGSRKIQDSGSYDLYDRAENENVEIKSLFSEFQLDARAKTNYYLEIETFDLNHKTKYTQGLNIYKENNFSDQNFLITVNGAVAFKNNFLKSDVVTVKFANRSVPEVMVDCFLREFGPALPPFSTKTPDEFKYKPDSVFTLKTSGNTFDLVMPEKGFLHVKSDPMSQEGLTLYTYDKTFPGVSNSEEMINCTRYIMSKDEFEFCKASPDKKAVIDKFWLDIGGSNERARELLKRYYGRVKESNKYYTTYTQGWKSDRGMIFIVFGPPTNVYRSRKDEIWVYGNEANPGTLRFIFNKSQSPFSDNDFIMERSQFYKEAWHNAVDYWRQGNIYMDGKK